MVSKAGRCLSKDVVYRTSCLHYGLVYIGETRRTIGCRIKKHLEMSKQTVYSVYKKKASL